MKNSISPHLTKEFNEILDNYHRSLNKENNTKLDLYSKTKITLNDPILNFKRKTEMEEDASEYDEIVYNGVPYKKAYHIIKYNGSQANPNLRSHSTLDILSNINTRMNNNIPTFEEEEYNLSPNLKKGVQKKSTTLKLTKLDKIYKPIKAKNNSMIIKEEDILPMINIAKMNTIDRKNSLNNSLITDKSTMKEMKSYLINKVEQSFSKNNPIRTKSNGALTIDTGVNINNLSHCKSPSAKFCIDPNYAIKISNAIEDSNIKLVLNKIQKQFVTNDVITQITNVQKKLIEKAKLKVKTFRRYRSDSEELRRRYIYIFKNNFV